MFPLVAGESEIASARKAALFLLHGMIAEGNGINGVQQLRGQKDVQMLRQIAPAHILHFADVGLQDKILGVGGEFPELLQGGQAIGRLLDSGQEIPILRGEGGQSSKRCLQLCRFPLLGEHCFQIVQRNIRFTFCHSHPPFAWETPV